MSARRAVGPGRTATLALALGALGCAEDRPLDVVLVSLDSVRADVLTFRDERGSPRMTALAEEGTVFTSAVSGTSWTLPAHAQMFTGLPPVVHGVQYDDLAIDPAHPTLPELLSAEGYFTAGFWTGWYLAGEYGFARGFDVYENAMSDGAAIEREYRAAVESGNYELAKRVLGGRDRLSHQDVTSERVAERVEALLARVPQDRPLFLFAHLFDPHYDFVPPAPWDTAFDPDYTGDYNGRDFYNDPRIFDPTKSPRRRIPDRDLEHLFALYRGEVGWTDAAVGRVLDALEARGRLDHALVIVTSDHGDEFFEHGGRGHRHTLFDELLRVPLLVRLPAGHRTGAVPRTVSTQVTLSDLTPTVLDVVGAELPATLFGRSLLPALRGESLESRPAVASLTVTGTGPGGTEVDLLLDAVRTDEFKLVRRLELSGDLPTVAESLGFDLARDPGETRPLPSDDPRIREAHELLDAELERLRRHWETLPRTPDAERTTDVRELFESELSALGYGGEEPETEGSPGLGMPWGLAPHPPPRRP